jgi:hypothetical protein
VLVNLDMGLMKYLPRLALNQDPLDLSLQVANLQVCAQLYDFSFSLHYINFCLVLYYFYLVTDFGFDFFSKTLRYVIRLFEISFNIILI